MSETSSVSTNSLRSLNGLSIQFEKIADRFTSSILIENKPFAISVEGGSSDPWPPSPPFQELSIEDRGNSGKVALLVGMAGKSHWSAAIYTNDLGLEFDIACRANGPSEYLKSSYSLVESLECSSIDKGLQIETDSTSVRIEAINGCELCFPERQCVEVVAIPSREKTIRWKYQIFLRSRD